MIIDSSPQGTPEWLQARCGVLTASEFGKLITPTGKATTGKTRQDYLLEKANEIITGVPCGEAFVSTWMERGTELEPQARAFYEFVTGNEVSQAGLIYRDESRRVGASVDGLINDDGNQEIKCPKLTTHLRYILDGELPREYIAQVQGQLLVTGRDYCDFISYHPGAFRQGFILTVERDEKYIKQLQSELDRALEEIEQLTERFKEAA